MCILGLCGAKMMFQFFFMFGMFWKHGVCGLCINKRCGGEACNTRLFTHGDVHVHQPKKDHWVFQGAMEGEGGGNLWYL